MKSKNYEEFVDKFKPQKTTDDCYTPPEVYAAIRDWACRKYNILPEKIVRPFWPGGDYEHFDYPKGCVVLDNPPFSILAKICDFYLEQGIPFFLLAPTLTALSSRQTMRMNHLICDAPIVYDNGAVVNTSFVTSFGNDLVVQSAPELWLIINNAVEKLKKAGKKEVPKYEYPDHVLTAAMVGKYSRYGIDFKVAGTDCIHIRGLLLSNRAATEKAAAEKAAAEKAGKQTWHLSDRERAIVERLGK